MTPTLAAIDVGTNTIRLLVARPSETGLTRVVDASETVRLGRGVDASGQLADDRMTAAADAIARFAERARKEGASEIIVVATSAVRDAANQDAFLDIVQRRSGLEVQVIDGDREAILTSRGALLGRSAHGEQVIVDIGGGSTEVIAVRDGAIQTAKSYQLGSSRLTERCLPSDPPTPGEIDAALLVATAVLDDLAGAPGTVAVLTAGTAEALLRLTPRAEGDDRLSRAQLVEVLTDLLGRPAAATAEAGLVDRDRARVLPGGIVIIQALMNRLRIDTVFISRGGLREGALLEYLANDKARGA